MHDDQTDLKRSKHLAPLWSADKEVGLVSPKIINPLRSWTLKELGEFRSIRSDEFSADAPRIKEMGAVTIQKDLQSARANHVANRRNNNAHKWSQNRLGFKAFKNTQREWETKPLPNAAEVKERIDVIEDPTIAIKYRGHQNRLHVNPHQNDLTFTDLQFKAVFEQARQMRTVGEIASWIVSSDKRVYERQGLKLLGDTKLKEIASQKIPVLHVDMGFTTRVFRDNGKIV